MVILSAAHSLDVLALIVIFISPVFGTCDEMVKG